MLFYPYPFISVSQITNNGEVLERKSGKDYLFIVA